MDPSVWTRLPEDIQLKIALKLPIRNVLRGKLVCKHWRTAITGSRVYAWMCYMIIPNGDSQTVHFRYLPRVFYKDHILACSRGGLMLVHNMSTMVVNEPPFVVTHPFTKRWHAIPYILPPGLKPVTRIHSSIHDTPESFKLLLVLALGRAPQPVESFHVSVYKPETGWRHVGVVNLDKEKMVVLCRSFPLNPMIFHGEALYFLSAPISSSFRDSGEYTLNRVHVGDGEACLTLEKLACWSDLPWGMWPVKNRVHPRLVLSSGHLLLVGTSFHGGGKQGPIVFLAFQFETSSWSVLDKVEIPGYVAKPVARPIIDTYYCRYAACAELEECFCYEDYMVVGWDDEVVFSFPNAHPGQLCDRSINFLYELSSKLLSKFTLLVVDEPEPVSRKHVVRFYLETWGRVPENTADQLTAMKSPYLRLSPEDATYPQRY